MHIIHIHVHVKPEYIEAFSAAILENARASANEPGVIRFDVLQLAAEPTRFVLVEIYRSPEAQLAHRETAHYLKWRDSVAAMMAEPRVVDKMTALLLSAPKSEHSA